MANMGMDALRDTLSNPAKTYLWEVLFANPIGGGDGNLVELRCQTTNIPGRGHGEILIPYKGTPGIKFPGRLTMDHSWAVTFIEGTDKKVFDFLHGWQQAITNDRTGIGGPDIAIKSDIYLRCLRMDNDSDAWLTIKLIGCYPQTVDSVPLTYEDDTSIFFNCTFSFDRWEEA